MLPDVVTFWHGPMDALRLTCLRSQVAAGHKVTVYRFEPIHGLPEGVDSADAEAILPLAFSEKLRRAGRHLVRLDHASPCTDRRRSRRSPAARAP